MVPKVGIPLIDELVLSEIEGGQAPQCGWKPRGIFKPKTGFLADPLILTAVSLDHLKSEIALNRIPQRRF